MDGVSFEVYETRIMALTAEIERLTVERDRLRAALCEIADDINDGAGLFMVIARRAVAEGTKE